MQVGTTDCYSLVWLPETRVLFAGDLIYGGRYPVLAPADIPQLVEVFWWFLQVGAEVIVPGHGNLCGNGDLTKQLAYIETTWKRTEEHIVQGHSLEEKFDGCELPPLFKCGYELT